MHFVHAGQGRPALVFVHGFACASADWREQLAFFSKSREVAACDLRGHGATPGRPHECTIEHYGGDVAALVHHLEMPKCVLIGHSMGCRVVLEAARLDPERVAGLVLLDGSRQATGDPQAADAATRALLEAQGYGTFMRAFFEAMFLEKTPQSQAAVERALGLPADLGTELFASMARWDAGRMEAALDAVAAPVLAIQSTYVNTERKRVPLKPGETTPWLDLLRQRLPDLRTEIVSGTGHFPQLEVPQKINALLAQFLL